MADKTTDASSRPEFVRNRRIQGRQAQYSFPSTPLPHGIQFIFEEYDYNKFVSTLNKGEGLTTNASDDPNSVYKFGLNTPISKTGPVVSKFTSIELPFPRSLVDANNIRNEQFERSFLFERLVSSLSSAGDFTGIIDQLGTTAKDILSGFRNVGRGEGFKLPDQIGGKSSQEVFGNVSAAAQYLGRSVLPGDLGKQLGQGGGFIANPQQSLAFTGVDLKNYSFEWDFFPSNKDDSEQIKKIIQILKHHSLPGVSNAGVADVRGLGRAFLTYPSVVIINLLGVDESHFVRFKPAMLTNVTVNYGNNGMISILKGGKPSALTLSLSFTEMNIHTREDYPLIDDTDASVKSGDPGTPDQGVLA